jgi:adenylate cyclase
MSNFVRELRRRNVFRIAIAYVAVAWLIVQIADVVFESFGSPDWVMKTLIFLLAVGFPVAILFAWAYEMTPEGLKREREVDRSQSVTPDTGRKLNRIIIGVLVAAVGFLLVDKFMLRQTTPQPIGDDKSVAVLPFVAMSSGPDDEYFADGLTEEILNSLTRVPELLVTARTSAFHFKGKDIPIPDVAAQLGVAHVVEGSVRRDGDRLRVTAQLIRAADGFHLWSENYDRDTEDTFGVQTDIAEKIASALDVFLDERTLARMKASGFRNPEAYIAYQKGFKLYGDAHNYWDIFPRLAEANRWLEQVIELEPGRPLVYLMHADYYTHQLRDVYESLSADEIAAAEENMRADLDAAVEVATSDADRWSAMFDRAFLTGNWRSISDYFDNYFAAVDCPASVWINSFAVESRSEDVAKIAAKLRKCDPRNMFSWRDGIVAALWAGDTDRAIELGEEGLAAIPEQGLAMMLNYAYLAAGRLDDAEDLIDRAFTEDDFRDQMALSLAAARGDAERTRELLAAVVEAAPERKDIALMYLAQAGERERANRIAAELDVLPYGYLTLTGIPSTCSCGMPWDLEVTPNFASKLEAAGLEWPDSSPVEWPLKDW